MVAQCPFCHFKEEVPEQYAGMIGECSQCGKDYKLPCKTEETPNTILAICPNCQYGEEIDTAYLGETVTCLQCNTTFVVGEDVDNVAKQAVGRCSPQRVPMLHRYNSAHGSVNRKTISNRNVARVYRPQSVSNLDVHYNNAASVSNNPAPASNPAAGIGAFIGALLVIVIIVAIIFETIGQHKANRLLDDTHKSFEQIDKQFDRINNMSW